MKPASTPAIIPLLLTLAMVFAPLAASYTWTVGRHADESQLQYHHLLEHLSPYPHHHPVGPMPGEGVPGLEAGDQNTDAAVLVGAAMVAVPLLMAAAPGIVNYLDGAAVALPTSAIAFIIWSSLTMLLWLHSLRPQSQPVPLGKPPNTPV